MVLRDQALALVGRDHRRADRLGEPAHGLARALVHRVEPRDDQRPPGLGQPPPRLGRIRGDDRRRGGPAHGRRRRHPRRGRGDRDVDVHGPRPALQRDSHGLVGERVGGARNQAQARLDDRLEDAGVVEHLVGVGRGLLGVDAARDDDQRHAVLARVGDGVDAVHRAGAQRRQQDPGRSGGVPGALGHEARGGLVARQHGLDPGGLEGVHQRQDLAAGHPEGVAAPGLGEPPGQPIGGPGRLDHRGAPFRHGAGLPRRRMRRKPSHGRRGASRRPGPPARAACQAGRPLPPFRQRPGTAAAVAPARSRGRST